MPYVVTVRLMFSVNILKVGSVQKILNSFGLVGTKRDISCNCLSRASTVGKFRCTLKSWINFNSADSSSSPFAFSIRTRTSSKLVEEFWETLLHVVDFLEVALAFYIFLGPLGSSLEDLIKQMSPEETSYCFGFFALVFESLSTSRVLGNNQQ